MLWILFLISPALAQLQLPTEQWLPPPLEQGTRSTAGSEPNEQWSNLLGNLLYFYEAQRSGEQPATNRVDWRNSSCTDDGADVGASLGGGYFDAGDYVKFTFPLSFTLTSICWAAADFGDGYEKANQTVYLDHTLRWGLDWLIKAHPEERKIYVQVGDAKTDNGYWGGDRDVPTPRPTLQITDSKPGTDVAAGVSAAFAACSGLYAGKTFGEAYTTAKSLKDTSYAEILLEHAHQTYDFALNAKGGQKVYQQSVPAASEAYASSGFKDEIVFAALFLAWADGDSTMFEDAKSKYEEYKLGGQNGVFNWDSKTPGLAVLFAQIASSGSNVGKNAEPWRTEAERYFDNIANEEYGSKGPISTTKGGLLYYEGDSDAASLNPALNAAMLMTRYANIASTDDKKRQYLNFAQSQVDYWLGNNPMSAPYVIGVNPNSPKNPHSAPASGGNDIGRIDEDPEETAHILYGAVVGGPGRDDRFYDIRSDWPETEVALDYNSPALALAAMHVQDDSNDPFYTKLKEGAYDKVKPKGRPCDQQFRCGPSKLSQAAKIAILTTTIILGLIIIALVGWYIGSLIKKRKAAQGGKTGQ